MEKQITISLESLSVALNAVESRIDPQRKLVEFCRTECPELYEHNKSILNMEIRAYNEIVREGRFVVDNVYEEV